MFHQVKHRISIFDIVREESRYNVERSSSKKSQLLSTHVPDDGISTAVANFKNKSQAECHAPHSTSQCEGRTVQCCRNVDSRIRALRENWDMLR